jgi:hypothetical protein
MSRPHCPSAQPDVCANDLGVNMRLYLPDLDPATRQYMLREFDSEQAGLPFVPAGLSAHGRSGWPTMMRNQRQGVIRTRRVGPAVTTASGRAS